MKSPVSPSLSLFYVYRLAITMLAGLSLFLIGHSLADTDLPSESAALLHDLIAPTPSENKWLEIQWNTDLPTAQKLAAEQGKPIFLWQMDGHPLGCV